MERKVYSSTQPTPVRKEWVELPDGRSICVHGLSTAAYASLKSRCARHPNDPRGGDDPAMLYLVQLALSCYDSDEPDAKRIFGDLDLDKAGLLTFEEAIPVLAAINRVNGLDASLQELQRDFMLARPEPSSSP